MFTPYTFAGRRIIDAQGRTLVYSDSDAAANGADERISVYADGAHLGTIRPGATIELDRAPSRWELVPVSSTGLLSGTVHIGEGKFDPGTINGIVTVIDGELARTVQGYQGIALVQRTAAVNYPALAIIAYTAGFSAAIRRLMLDANSTQNLRLWTAQVSGEPTFNERRAIRNKSSSLAPTEFPVASGAAYALTDSTTTGSSTPDCDPTKFSNWVDWGPMRVNQTSPRLVLDAAPLLLPAGYAMVVVGGTLASLIGLQAEIEAIAE